MKQFMTAKSWKTTSAGLLTIGTVIITLYFSRKNLTPELLTTQLASFLTGAGLLFARDNDKTSEDVGAVTKE